MTRRILYELTGRDDRRFSPYCWRARLALVHKGLDFATEPCRFTDKEKIAFSGGKTYPVLQDGERTVVDSWAIACYLEETYREAPSLFGDAGGKSLARFLALWTERSLFPAILPAIIGDVFDRIAPEDREYFRSTREARFGRTIEELAADRDRAVERLRATLEPARALLQEQPFLCGEAPAYGDYIVFGAFQWIRGVGDAALLAEDDPVNTWIERMLDLHDGFARGAFDAPAVASAG